MTKPRARGDKQLRSDDSFDRARAAGEQTASLRKSNRCKADAVIDERTKITMCSDNWHPEPERVIGGFATMGIGRYLVETP